MRQDPLNLGCTASTVKQEITARFENTEIGKCPVCHVGMETAEIAEVPCYVCVEHCVCLPKPDAE